MDVCLKGGANGLPTESIVSHGPAHGRKLLMWAALGGLLALYVLSALRINPVSAFGTVLDDGLYFSTAQALARGQGYILPSFPVRLQATKYPELYPLLLAGIWKIDPHFPDNVNLAAGVTLAFGCATVVFVFLLLRRWPGMEEWEALAVAGLCVLSGYFLDLSASVMTDVPFMALMLAAIWMIECSAGRDGKRACWWAIGAGMTAGVAVGFRIFGAAVIGGIGLVLLGRRDFRRLFCFSLAAAPPALLFLWPALVAIIHPAGAHLAIGPGDSGWTQTLCYYSSYACNWHSDVSGAGALRAVIWENLKGIIQQPGLYLLSPLAASGGLWGIVGVALASIGSYAGIVRYTRKAGWQPLTASFLLFLPVILIWPYTPDRFLVAFLPLFFGGLWLEGKHLAGLISQNLRPAHSLSDRCVAGLLAAGGLALAVMIAVNYAWAIPSKVTGLANANEMLLRDERAAYTWIRNHSAANSRVISYRDGLTYLYTGRPAIAPIYCNTQAFYQNDPRYAERDAARLADVARHVGASYWLASTEDFRLDGNIDYRVLQQREGQLLTPVPLVFESSDKRVRVYYVGCDFGAAGESCSEDRAARRSASSGAAPAAAAR